MASLNKVSPFFLRELEPQSIHIRACVCKTVCASQHVVFVTFTARWITILVRIHRAAWPWGQTDLGACPGPAPHQLGDFKQVRYPF